MAVEQFAQHIAHNFALAGQAHQHRTAVGFRAFMVDVTALDQLFEIVGNIGAEIMAAGAQFAGGQFLVADIEQQQRLHGIDLAFVAAIQFVLDDIEKLAVKPLNQVECFEIMLAYGRCAF
jgi:hypothetical protein